MLNERSKQVRRDTIKLSKANGGYHFGGSFSCVEILIAIYDHVINFPVDRFIMSKGHACFPYYVILKERGFNPKLEGHPKRDVVNGVHCTTGSMGHGLPTAVGIAMAKKIKGEGGKVYVLMGDGECQEGTTWESMLIAGKHKLDNLVVIVDNNGIQGSGRVGDILPDIVLDTAARAGWSTYMAKGHDIENIIQSFDFPNGGNPRFIQADTIKGKGVSFMEDKPEWHAKWLDDKHEALAMEELEAGELTAKTWDRLHDAEELKKPKLEMQMEKDL
jgi:transketolase